MRVLINFKSSYLDKYLEWGQSETDSKILRMSMYSRKSLGKGSRNAKCPLGSTQCRACNWTHNNHIDQCFHSLIVPIRLFNVCLFLITLSNVLCWNHWGVYQWLVRILILSLSSLKVLVIRQVLKWQIVAKIQHFAELSWLFVYHASRMHAFIHYFTNIKVFNSECSSEILLKSSVFIISIFLLKRKKFIHLF